MRGFTLRRKKALQDDITSHSKMLMTEHKQKGLRNVCSPQTPYVYLPNLNPKSCYTVCHAYLSFVLYVVISFSGYFDILSELIKRLHVVQVLIFRFACGVGLLFRELDLSFVIYRQIWVNHVVFSTLQRAGNHLAGLCSRYFIYYNLYLYTVQPSKITQLLTCIFLRNSAIQLHSDVVPKTAGGWVRGCFF